MLENIGKMAGKIGGTDALKGYLSGLSFPIEKAKLIEMATSKGLPDPLVGLLNKLPDHKFQSADDVVKEAQTLQ